MSNNLFYGEIRKIRGGFLRVMFEICSKTGKSCSFCGFSTYDPITGKFDDQEKDFCGVASSFDGRVSSLPDCWLEMSKSQRSTYVKNKNQEYSELILRRKR
jgi:hypothetical protein